MEELTGKIAQKYKNILDNTEPYLLAHSENFEYVDMSPWGIEIPENNLISCLSMKHEKFFDLILELDRLTFQKELNSATTDKWVYFDCAEMPGGIFGFGIKARLLDERVLRKYNVSPDYEGLIPISMVSSVPKISRDEWVGLLIASAAGLFAGKFSGLGLLTYVMGLKVFHIRRVFGVMQKREASSNLFPQVADMEILSTYTPAHSSDNSMLTFKCVFTDDALLKALSGKPRNAEKWDFLYPADDEKFSMDMQKKIEKGAKYTIVGRPIMRDGRVFYPVSENK